MPSFQVWVSGVLQAASSLRTRVSEGAQFLFGLFAQFCGKPHSIESGLGNCLHTREFVLSARIARYVPVSKLRVTFKLA